MLLPLSSAQERMMHHARKLAVLGLPVASNLPENLQDGFLARDLLSAKGARITTLRALIRKGYLEVAAIYNDGDDVVLRLSLAAKQESA